MTDEISTEEKGDYEEWQYRVFEERIQLDEKIDKLCMSLASNEFIVLISEGDRQLLDEQLIHMKDYREILRIRILKFDE